MEDGGGGGSVLTKMIMFRMMMVLFSIFYLYNGKVASFAILPIPSL